MCVCLVSLASLAGGTWGITARVPHPGGYRVLELTAGLVVISIACIPDLRDWGTLLGPLGTLMSKLRSPASAEVWDTLPQLLYCTVLYCTVLCTMTFVGLGSAGTVGAGSVAATAAAGAAHCCWWRQPLPVIVCMRLVQAAYYGVCCVAHVPLSFV
jgi:hypothetical protein